MSRRKRVTRLTLVLVPESPRFLVQRDCHQQALEVLIRLHRDPSDPSNTFANQELQLIVERCQAEKDIIRTDGRWRLFTKKANRRKLLLAWLVMVGGQNIGPLVINNYNVLLYGSLGLGATRSLLLSAVYNSVGLIIACIGGAIADRLGRRKCLSKLKNPTPCWSRLANIFTTVTGYVLITIVFAILTAMIARYNQTPTKGWAAAAVTMVYAFVVWHVSLVSSCAMGACADSYASPVIIRSLI